MGKWKTQRPFPYAAAVSSLYSRLSDAISLKQRVPKQIRVFTIVETPRHFVALSNETSGVLLSNDGRAFGVNFYSSVSAYAYIKRHLLLDLTVVNIT